MKNINTRLQEMTNKLSSKDLFESNGLGNEINFHVFDYDPEDEYVVREYLENKGITFLEAEVQMVPTTTVALDEAGQEKMERLINQISRGSVT